MLSRKEKLIAIVGPTASGKSELAVKIAKRFNGEIISADSRQVYRGLDIGTGKVPNDFSNYPRISSNASRITTSRIRGKFDIIRGKFEKYVYKGVPHYCIDFVSPKKVFTVADFKKCAEAAIKDITNRGKIPILCGGTGFYIDSVLYNLPIPNVPPNQKLRKQLSKKSAEELFKILKKMDPKRAKTIDPHNPRRLIRAIEIVKTTGKPVQPHDMPPMNSLLFEHGRELSFNVNFSTGSKNKIRQSLPAWNALIIGINVPKKELYRKIDQRLKERLKQGMVQEVKNLLKKGVSHKRLQSLGLEYRFVSLYLQNKLAYQEMTEKLKNAIYQYAKKQMTWFKRNKKINWINSED